MKIRKMEVFFLRNWDLIKLIFDSAFILIVISHTYRIYNLIDRVETLEAQIKIEKESK